MYQWLLKAGILVLTVFSVVTPIRADELADSQQLAVASSDEWLKLVDAGNFSESWQKCSSYFRSLVPEDKWTVSIDAVRKPLGLVVARKLQSATHLNSLPGAPDGQYFVIVYETSFENKAAGIETITPMLDSDGRWAVSGYYIK